MISSKSIEINKNKTNFKIDSNDLDNLTAGTGTIKIFAISKSVLKPDFYESSFIVTEDKEKLPESSPESTEFSENETQYEILIIPVIMIVGIIILLKKRHSNP